MDSICLLFYCFACGLIAAQIYCFIGAWSIDLLISINGCNDNIQLSFKIALINFMLFILLLVSSIVLPAESQSISTKFMIIGSNKNYTSVPPTWLTSPYLRAGYEGVITSYTGSNVPSTSYTFTFSSALPGIPNLAYGIKNYRGKVDLIFRERLLDAVVLWNKKDGSDCCNFYSIDSDIRFHKFMEVISGLLGGGSYFPPSPELFRQRANKPDEWQHRQHKCQ